MSDVSASNNSYESHRTSSSDSQSNFSFRHPPTDIASPSNLPLSVRQGFSNSYTPPASVSLSLWGILVFFHNLTSCNKRISFGLTFTLKEIINGYVILGLRLRIFWTAFVIMKFECDFKPWIGRSEWSGTLGNLFIFGRMNYFLVEKRTDCETDLKCPLLRNYFGEGLFYPGGFPKFPWPLLKTLRVTKREKWPPPFIRPG